MQMKKENMTDFLATRLDQLKPSPTLAVTSKAAELRAQGIDVIGLGAGEPDFDTPENIKESAIDAINRGETKYTPVDGTPKLKAAIIHKFKTENNLDFKPSEIIVGCGAKHVIFNALFATLNPGDEVIIPAPYWVSYPDMVKFAEGSPIIVETDDTNDFKMSASQLEQSITDKTKWLILNSPSNPTGSAYTRDELQALAEVLLKHPHVHILSDDIYEHITYDSFKFATIAEIAPKLKSRVLTVNGVSKAYAMTGWRIGYGAGDEALIKSIKKIQSQSTSNPCSISQAASIEALTGVHDYIDTNNAKFKKRRDFVCSELEKIDGLTYYKPVSAFYVFPNCKALIGKSTPDGQKINNDTDFCKLLLEQGLVAAVPGNAFGAEGFFRISYATSEENLEKALQRIAKFCASLN